MRTMTEAEHRTNEKHGRNLRIAIENCATTYKHVSQNVRFDATQTTEAIVTHALIQSAAAAILVDATARSGVERALGGLLAMKQRFDAEEQKTGALPENRAMRAALLQAIREITNKIELHDRALDDEP